MYFLIIYIFLLVNFWFFTLFSLLAVFCISSLTVFTVTHQNTKVNSLNLTKTPKEIIQKPVLICWKLSLTIELRGSAESSVCWFYITENIRISVFCQATVLRLIVSVLFALVLESSSSATNQMEGNGFFWCALQKNIASKKFIFSGRKKSQWKLLTRTKILSLGTCVAVESLQYFKSQK